MADPSRLTEKGSSNSCTNDAPAHGTPSSLVRDGGSRGSGPHHERARRHVRPAKCGDVCVGASVAGGVCARLASVSWSARSSVLYFVRPNRRQSGKDPSRGQQEASVKDPSRTSRPNCRHRAARMEEHEELVLSTRTMTEGSGALCSPVSPRASLCVGVSALGERQRANVSDANERQALDDDGGRRRLTTGIGTRTGLGRALSVLGRVRVRQQSEMVEMEPPTSGGTDWADGCASIAPISPIADTEPEMGGRSGLPWLVWQGGHGAAVSGGEGGEGRLFFRVGVRFVALGAMPGARGPICRCRRRCPGPVDDLFESGPRCDAMRCDGSAGDGRMDGRTAGEASPSVALPRCAVRALHRDVLLRWLGACSSPDLPALAPVVVVGLGAPGPGGEWTLVAARLPRLDAGLAARRSRHRDRHRGSPRLSIKACPSRRRDARDLAQCPARELVTNAEGGLATHCRKGKLGWGRGLEWLGRMKVEDGRSRMGGTRRVHTRTERWWRWWRRWWWWPRASQPSPRFAVADVDKQGEEGAGEGRGVPAAGVAKGRRPMPGPGPGGGRDLLRPVRGGQPGTVRFCDMAAVPGFLGSAAASKASTPSDTGRSEDR
ncbi:hypothetical protein PCL_00642 [Purpureocillium lilacinum]|uniref:Uncharacterized protein n=1 Tax=Purpureocillium lilacinum TaxID=33203 RepID=A0A2U3E5D7_PURLI|nr:hypothetical protein PCL_00642 [Purpureocillium lilacinum]